LQVAAEGLFPKAEAPLADRSLFRRRWVLPLKQHKLGIAGALVAVLIVLAAASFSVYSIFHRVTPIAFRNFTVPRVANSGRAELAAISPDGRYLLNVQNEEGKESLWLRNLPTNSDTQVLPLSASFYTSLAFSPDGNYIYYREAANKFLSGFNLYRAPVLGGTPRLIVENIDTAVTFSPDGSRMAFARSNDPDLGKTRLMSAKPDGTDQQVLRIGSYYPVLFSAAWSPDGKRIACSLFLPDNKVSGIDIFDIATGHMHSFVRFDDKFVLDTKWLPNGRALIVQYQEKSGRGTQIGFIAYPGGQFRTITNDTNSYSAFSLSADGRTLATVQVEESSEISILSGTGAGVATSIPHISRRTVIHDVTWARDGKLLISEDNRLVRMASDGNGAVTVLNDFSAYIQEVESCVDGRSIVVSWLAHAGTNSQNVWRADVDGSNLAQLSNGKFDTSPVCSPDGKWVYYIDGADSRVMRVSINGGTPEQVPASVVRNTNLFKSAISPDGKTLVYAFSGVEGPEKHTVSQKLAIVNLTMNSDTPRVLDIDPRASLFVQFTPDGKNVAYPIEDRGIGNIWLQPIDGSKGRQITSFTLLTISGFRWSPDGKSLLVHRTQRTSDVVLLRESENADSAESVR
jgi:eukaryotic-like serine/threonine-protein kinase